MSILQYEYLDEESRLFLRLVKDFVERQICPYLEAAERDGSLPEDLPLLMHRNQLLCVTIPEDRGGGGGDLLIAVLVVQQVAQLWAAASCVPASAYSCAIAFLTGDGPAQQDLVRLIEGDFPVLVNGTGRAVRAERTSTGWRLDGHVDRVENAAAADFLVVLAEEPSGETLALMVDAPLRGLEIGSPRNRTGLRGAPASGVLFRGCELGAQALIGRSQSVHAAHQCELLCTAAQATGIAEGALVAAKNYVTERHQFGRKLSSFPSLRVMLAEMWADQLGLSLALHQVAKSPHILSPDGKSICAAVTRRAANRAVSIAIDAVQLHGGYGYIREFPVERMLRDAVSVRARAGGGRRQLETVAQAALG